MQYVYVRDINRHDSTQEDRPEPKWESAKELRKEYDEQNGWLEDISYTV